MRRSAVLPGQLLLLAIAVVSPLHARPCSLSSGDREWIAAAIGAWGRASVALARPMGEMPWAIVYDERCVLHFNPRDGKPPASPGALAVSFNGRPVATRSAAYRKRFTLPSGQKLTSDALAFTSLARDGGTFFVMALPSVWAKDPRSMPGEDISAFATGVLAHEITHTLHLASIGARMAEIGERYAVPVQLDDDYLQSVFEKNAAYVADYDREIVLYRRAVEMTDDAAARATTIEALDASEARRARHFQGEHAYFREVEPLFLNMEGVASWVAYTVAGGGADPLAFSGRYWSQQEGLFLFLLLDRFDPAWKQWVFDAGVPDPLAMLRKAAAGGA